MTDELPHTAGLSGVPLPTHGKREREHLYAWVEGEEGYVEEKFDDQRNGHDDTLREYDLEAFWIRQVFQYFDRAKGYLQGAREMRIIDDGESARHLELLAQQAMIKAMMTAKGAVESSIRVYGPLPKPGLSSGNIEPWE